MLKKLFLTIALALVWAVPATELILAQTAPPIEKNKHEADLLELIKLDQTIKLDIRYARTDNFVGKAVYTEARAFLQRPTAEALLQVHQKLKKQGLGLVIFDGYRPWSVTKLFWEVTSADKRKFVADPLTGSRHNRGCAVDLSIYHLTTGQPLPMPSDFDEFTDRASPNYTGGTNDETANRDLLRRLMEEAGFTVNKDEWWHFDYKDWADYAIYDIAFAQIRNFDLLKNYRVRRVQFAGKLFSDRKVHKNVFLREGEEFSEVNLDKSIASLNKSNLFERITTQDVSWNLFEKDRVVDFVFYLKAKRNQ